jgi:hypothetical protein
MDGLIDTKVQATFAMPRASDWIWRPLYAKLWWFGVSLWWTAFMASPRNSLLTNFFDTPAAGYLSVLFLPFAPVLVLGARFVSTWLDARHANWQGWAAESNGDVWSPTDWADHDRSFKKLRMCTDTSDRRSGVLWTSNPINPLSPQNPLNQRR